MILQEYRSATTTDKLTQPAKVFNLVKSILDLESETDQDKEHIWVIGCRANLMIRYIELVGLGTLQQAITAPREIYRTAVMMGVDSIFMVHNHPSGEPTPSKADEDLTHAIKHAGDILGISLRDHVIVGANEFYSFAEHPAGGF